MKACDTEKPVTAPMLRAVNLQITQTKMINAATARIRATLVNL